MSVVGIKVEVRTAFGTQATAILPAQWLKGQFEHYVVAKQRLKIKQVTLQPAGFVICGVAARIDVELLDVDLLLANDLN